MHNMSPTIRSIRRRNALVPLPLLPPVPRNTIVTSVRIVHNHCTSDSNIFDTSPLANAPQVRAFSNSPSPPPSPTPTNLCFAPITGGAGKRLRSGRRRSSCTPCQQPPGSQRPPPATTTVQKSPPSNSVAVPFDTGTDSPMDPPTRQQSQTGGNGADNNFDSSLLNPNRKPRSTVLVTVRLANPPPSNGSYGSRPPNIAPVPRRPPCTDRGTNDGGGTVLGTGPRSPPGSRSRPPNIAPTPRRPHYIDTGPHRHPYGDTNPNHQPPDPAIGVGGAFAAMQAWKMAHRPRVSSPLVASVFNVGEDPDRMELDPWDVSPLSSPPASWSPLYVGGNVVHPRGPFSPGARRYSKGPKGGGGGGSKKGGKGKKNGGSLGMLRWAVLNHSGPEVGRRILAMGPKLAMEIWESERVIEEMDAVRPDEMEVVGNHEDEDDVEAPGDGDTTVLELIENYKHGSTVQAPDDGGTVPMENYKHGSAVEVSDDGGTILMEQPQGSDTEDHRNREKLAEECIRELEEMDVDLEDIEMEPSSASSTTEASTLTPPTLEATTTTTTEKATETETPKTENNNNNNRMDLDMPAPVAVVTPLSTARQVQIQLEIAVEVFSPAKKAKKDAEKSKRWFERIAL